MEMSFSFSSWIQFQESLHKLRAWSCQMNGDCSCCRLGIFPDSLAEVKTKVKPKIKIMKREMFSSLLSTLMNNETRASISRLRLRVTMYNFPILSLLSPPPPPPPTNFSTRCDASPSQGFLQHQLRCYPFRPLGEERHFARKVPWLPIAKKTTCGREFRDWTRLLAEW